MYVYWIESSLYHSIDLLVILWYSPPEKSSGCLLKELRSPGCPLDYFCLRHEVSCSAALQSLGCLLEVSCSPHLQS